MTEDFDPDELAELLDEAPVTATVVVRLRRIAALTRRIDPATVTREEFAQIADGLDGVANLVQRLADTPDPDRLED